MRTLISFAVLFLFTAASAIDYTSSKALQFFMPVHDFDEKNTVGFPQEVPSKAYYTDQDYVGKELRVTTNIASAVYSTVSGLLERNAWMCNIHDDLSYLNNSVQWRLWWDYEIYEDQDSFIDACRYRDFNLTDTYLSTAYKYATSRYIDTRRFRPASLLRDARNELILMATDTDRYDATYGNACNISSRYQINGWYVPQEYTRFPTFAWTSNLVYTIKSEMDWSEVLPTVFSAVWNDGLWKTKDAPEGTHYFSFLYPVFEWYAYNEERYNDRWVDIYDVDWDWDSTNLTWNIIRKYSSQQSLMPLSEILYGTFDWECAERFTNETLRVDYYTIGTVEHAVGAIDTSYELEDFKDNYLVVHNKSYEHRWSSYLPEGFVATNIPTKVMNEEGGWDLYLDIPPFEDGDWRRTEIWKEVTNRVTETTYPYHICTGDDPSYGGFLNASGPMFETSFEALLQEMDNFGTTSIRLQLVGPYIDLNGSSYIVDFGDLMMTKPCIHVLSGGASVSRTTQIETTLSEQSTNHVESQHFASPSKFAFEWGMIDHVYTQALQNRFLIVDPELDIYGDTIYWEKGTGAVWRVESRSESLGIFQNWDSLITRWKQIDPSLNASLESILPYPLRPRESLLPLPQNEIRKVENAVAGGGGMKMDFVSTGGNFRTYTINDSRDQMTVTVETDNGVTERFLYPGETETLGSISGSTNVTVDADHRIARRRPFVTEGKSTGLHTIRWRFNSIRPDYE